MKELWTCWRWPWLTQTSRECACVLSPRWLSLGRRGVVSVVVFIFVLVSNSVGLTEACGSLVRVLYLVVWNGVLLTVVRCT